MIALPRAGRVPSVAFGALAWVSTLQFFVAQAIVQSAWRTPFSLSLNYISDLGNTTCGPFPVGSGPYICSPWHAAMNASFVLTGAAIAFGAWRGRDGFGSGRLAVVGLALVALAGLGFVLVGVFPENVNYPPHRLGAALHFVGGNLGLVVLGVAMVRGRRGPAAYSIASGILGLAGTALFVTGHYGALGIGGMERVAAYPLPLWTIATGLGLWRESVRAHPGVRS